MCLRGVSLGNNEALTVQRKESELTLLAKPEVRE